MDSLEKHLRTASDWMCSRNDMLIVLLCAAYAISVATFSQSFDAEYGHEPWWSEVVVKGSLTAYSYLAAIGGFAYYVINFVDRTRKVELKTSKGKTPNGPKHPILLATRKESTKILALAMFTALDAILKARTRGWIVAFCTSFYLHLVHLMAFFRFTEDFDFAGGFLAASFGLLFEMCTWKEVIALVFATALLACYKAFLMMGVEALVRPRLK